MSAKPDRRGVRETRRVLVVNDEADIRELLDLTLARMGLVADCAATVAEAEELLAGQSYHLCLTDMRLPDGEGLSLVRLIGEHHPELPVAVITAHGSMENAVLALKAGAFDYLSKPVSLDQLRALVKSAIDLPVKEAVREAGGPRLLGDSAAMVQVRGLIERVARSQAPVYIAGESGSGKELAARLIHQLGPRAAAPFVPVNCGAIPENLMESEFFGYRKGAFTGADGDREGFFQAAHGGTLFLDEVADLPLAMQVKLLAGDPGEAGAEGGCHRRGTARRAHHQRHPSGPERHGRPGPVPAGPLLSIQCHRNAHAAAARMPRGHSPAGGPSPRSTGAGCQAGGAARAEPDGRRRSMPCGSTRSPATCANWRTCSNAPWPC